MKRAKLIPAPIDERNVTSDWIYEMFDLGDCVDDNGTYVGFINHVRGCVEQHEMVLHRDKNLFS